MRKLVTSNMVSLDGYLAGPGGDLSWHVMSDDFHRYAEGMMTAAGALVFGRLTYELMESYWPNEDVKTSDPIVAAQMNGLEKIVFSRTLKSVAWENTTLFSGEVEKNIARLKQQPGNEMVILGSGSIVSALTQAGLIDEHRIFICPVLLGRGTRQFSGHLDRKNLELTDLKKLSSGVVMLCYKPIK